jgi:hypothetical protein
MVLNEYEGIKLQLRILGRMSAKTPVTVKTARYRRQSE